MATHAAMGPVGRAESRHRGPLWREPSVRAIVAQRWPLVVAVIASVLVPTLSNAQDGWTPTSTTGAPTARNRHTAVWTGSKMIVWGGSVYGGIADSGAIFDPASNAWTRATNSVGAPTARNRHSAMWTGSKMVVWGGSDAVGYPDSGGVYDPSTDTWTATTTNGAPSGRAWHSAVWTGSKLIVWGGYKPGEPDYFNSGGLYDPSANTWAATTTSGVPTPRWYHSAVWAGSKMIVWGGYGAGGYPVATGGIYDPVVDSWTPTSTVGAPSARGCHSAVWTGSRMIVWGGGCSGGYLNTGGVFDPLTNTWAAMTTAGAPVARGSATAVWTGSRMIVWGGYNESYANGTGGRYDPATDTWTVTTLSGAPTPRWDHTAVWTGSRMIVWGGYCCGAFANTGGLYFDPALLPPPADFYAVTPCRVADTRNPTGPLGGPALAGGVIRTFPVTGGTCGVPSTAVAVAVNLTAVSPAATGHLTLFPGDAPGPPVASSVNFSAARTRANNAVVLLATDGTGTIKVKNGSAGTVHFVLDVNGYFQ